jgi:PKD repeat protein
VNPLSIEAGQAVDFNGALSYDPDSSGSIVNYSWAFGDGGTSSETNPRHIYNSAGSFEAALTVNDNLGDSDTATVTVEVTAPPFVPQTASADEFGAGTVSGNYLDTHDLSGGEQSIRERESGGKKNGRFSYLRHTWLFNVQPGDAATLALAGRQSASSDGDQMNFEYSVNNGPYQPLPIVLGNTYSSFADLLLQGAEGGGTVRLRVTDSDDTPGNRSLDTVYIDQIVIWTENQGGEVPPPPDPASALSALAVSSNQIDLSWSDNSSNESGFRIERSTDDIIWEEVAMVGAGQVAYSDSGLAAMTEYFYRVFAYNSGGDAAASDTASATTLDPPAIALTANGYKVRGRQHVSLSWTDVGGDADIYRDRMDIPHREGVSGYTFDDNIGTKGGGSYVYKVCLAGSGDCSAEEIVAF